MKLLISIISLTLFCSLIYLFYSRKEAKESLPTELYRMNRDLIVSVWYLQQQETLAPHAQNKNHVNKTNFSPQALLQLQKEELKKASKNPEPENPPPSSLKTWIQAQRKAHRLLSLTQAHDLNKEEVMNIPDFVKILNAENDDKKSSEENLTLPDFSNLKELLEGQEIMIHQIYPHE